LSEIPLCSEKQARAEAYILTGNAHIQYQLSVNSLSFVVLIIKSQASQTAKLSTPKCMLTIGCLWDLSGENEVVTAAKRCVELLNMLAKI